MTDTEQLLVDTDLIFQTDSNAGFSRMVRKNNFEYYSDKKEKIKDEKTLQRIKLLAIPPAWQNVWIAKNEKGHLQCTGIDAAGRKQYCYHSKWVSKRNETKYYRLLEFGQSLPDFRKKISKDLRRKELDERKVLAISVYTMQKTLIRIGNESYKKLYNTFGLTTLQDRHVKIADHKIQLSFVGKKSIKHTIIIKDKILAELVLKCKDIPGQELFQYYTPSGDHKSINSGMINNYIREITGCDFTAKDFRTWSGTLEAFRFLALHEFPEAITARKKQINSALDVVSQRLGNTRTVCKKSYVFPPLLEAYEQGLLSKKLKLIDKSTEDSKTYSLGNDEKILLSFLKEHRNVSKKQEKAKTQSSLKKSAKLPK